MRAGPAPVIERSRPSILLFSVFLVLALLFSLYPRVEQYRQLAGTTLTDVERSAPATSADSYYWFRLAREYRAGVDFREPDRLRHFPDGTPYEPLPAISRVFAETADLLGTDVYRAGLLLSVVFSSLFLIPLGLYGFLQGLPAAGILGGLVGSFSAAYYYRADVYRADTDGGNLFFVWLIALAMASMQSEQDPRRRHVGAVFAGLSVNAFCWWYGQAGFWLVYLVTFVLLLLSLACSWRQALSLLGLYFLCSNPLYFLAGLENMRVFVVDYLVIGLAASTEAAPGILVFPDATAEIQELQRMPFWPALATLLDQTFAAVLGLCGLTIFLVTRWRRLLPLLPSLALAVLGFVLAKRFLMYAAPLLGLGLGYLLTLAVSSLYRRGDPRGHETRASLVAELCLYSATTALVLVGLGAAVFSIRTGHAIDDRLVGNVEELGRTLPEGAAVLTSWGFGYLVSDVAGAATFDDGRDPDDVVQQLVSRGFTSPDPEELADIVTYLGHFGRVGVRGLIEESTSYEQLLDRIAEESASVREHRSPLYILFSEGMMLREFSLYYYKGQWDFEAAQGRREHFNAARCRKREERTLVCSSPGSRDLTVSLRNGLVDGRRRLKRILHIRRGEVIRRVEFDNQSKLSLELVEREGEAEYLGLLINDAVYRSNFNQMFVLGLIDSKLFREFSNDFPTTRSFRLLPRTRAPGHESGADQGES